MANRRIVCATVSAVVCFVFLTGALKVYAAPPGIATEHPNDVGLERDRRVLFIERFDQGELPAVLKRWTDASNRDNAVLSLVEDGPTGRGRALRMTATIGRNTGGNLYKRLDRGVDRVYARFYVKFPDDAGYIHHFVHLGGYNPPTNWPQGGAGSRPRGNDRFTVGIEPYGGNGRLKPPGAWNFYAYWPEMKVSAGGRYWGNSMTPVRPAVLPRGRWQCVEVMLKLNDPAKRDGELALWLDGETIMHIRRGVPRSRWTGMGFQLLEKGGEPFEGFRWRTTAQQKINFFWLLHYVTEGALRRNGVRDMSKPNHVFFDHIVVATEYIGPIKAPADGANR